MRRRVRPETHQRKRAHDQQAARSSIERDRFLAPVWHPEDHAALPDIVAHGRKPDVFACGFCHRANGQGGPENADPCGAARGLHHSTHGGLRERNESNRGAKPRASKADDVAGRDPEIAAGAAYFSALKPRARIRLVEIDVVPKTFWRRSNPRNRCSVFGL
jgi:mono/diheme cytochrome c family protein